MPALHCTCGTELDFSGAANPISWFLFSEAEQCALPAEAGMAEFVRLMKHAVLCPTCARLWIWWSKGTLPVEYVPASLAASAPPSPPTSAGPPPAPTPSTHQGPAAS